MMKKNNKRRSVFLLMILMVLSLTMLFLKFYEFPSTYENPDPSHLEKVKWLTSHPECTLRPTPAQFLNLPKVQISKKTNPSLSLWSQNILAGFFAPSPMKRLKNLSFTVKNRDIVALQELFAFQLLRKPKFQFHPYVEYPGKGKSFFMRTGVGLLSKFKLIETDFMLYSKSSSLDRLNLR